MWGNAYLNTKNLKHILDPGHEWLPSLPQLCFAMLATFGLRSSGSSLSEILDPHFIVTGVRHHSPKSVKSTNSHGKFLKIVTVITPIRLC